VQGRNKASAKEQARSARAGGTATRRCFCRRPSPKILHISNSYSAPQWILTFADLEEKLAARMVAAPVMLPVSMPQLALDFPGERGKTVDY